MATEDVVGLYHEAVLAEKIQPCCWHSGCYQQAMETEDEVHRLQTAEKFGAKLLSRVQDWLASVI